LDLSLQLVEVVVEIILLLLMDLRVIMVGPVVELENI
jgi:hypothetical protein